MARLQTNKLQIAKPLLYSNNRHDLSVLHINICNIKSKVRDIKCDEAFSHVDVISFNETHLSKPEDISGVTLGLHNAYSIFHKDCDGLGGGVALFVKCSCVPLHIPLNTTLEVVAVKISHPVEMTILSAYHSPTTNLKHFTDQMYHVLSKLDQHNICILGDFNVDVLGKNDTVLSSMFKKHSYTQIVRKPTRDSGTLIDHAYVTGELDVTSDVIDC